ncbi:MAG: methyltransferase type 12 [Rhodobacteraceae bacterium]|nr:methyltransferase type 12 [Paracoccaceae bacterium]
MGNDLGLFLGQVLKNPRQISAVVPSSAALAQEMVRTLGAGTGPVAEFGPGTGRITEAILSRGIAPADLTLFEMNEAFCGTLLRRFPGVTVRNKPAQSIAAADGGPFGAIVSGLPLLSFSDRLQVEIACAAFRALRPDGVFIQFTYGMKSPLTAAIVAGQGLMVEPGPVIWANLPPARVFRYRKVPTVLAAA